MSLLEDILHVLRMVLEYFGAPPEMLVPVWSCDLCGQYRSIVRMIGTNLPLQPTPRAHFQIALISHKTRGYVDVKADTPTIPSFADILWVCDDEGDRFTRTRNYLPPTKHSTVNRNSSRALDPLLHQPKRGFSSTKPTPIADPMNKISALEAELFKLRAQIAMIVTAPLTKDLSECAPLMSPPSPPTLTSTPSRPAAPLPPPPPPPPPPCPSSISQTQSLSDLIKTRRNNTDKNPQKPDSTRTQTKGFPSMLDVLKDLNQVKLRAVQRSPGGTPVVKRCSKGPSALHCDPAAMIAEALKKKFAQNHHNNSSDKENSRELSPFSSPETPKFPLHSRRSQGRRHM